MMKILILKFWNFSRGFIFAHLLAAGNYSIEIFWYRHGVSEQTRNKKRHRSETPSQCNAVAVKLRCSETPTGLQRAWALRAALLRSTDGPHLSEITWFMLHDIANHTKYHAAAEYHVATKYHVATEYHIALFWVLPRHHLSRARKGVGVAFSLSVWKQWVYLVLLCYFWVFPVHWI